MKHEHNGKDHRSTATRERDERAGASDAEWLRHKRAERDLGSSGEPSAAGRDSGRAAPETRRTEN